MKKITTIFLCLFVIMLSGCQSAFQNDTKSSTNSEIDYIVSTEDVSKEKDAASSASNTKEDNVIVNTVEDPVQPSTVKEVPEFETQLSRDRSTYSDDITYDMLSRYPDEYRDRTLKCTGTIFQVVEEDFILDGGYTHSAYLFSLDGNTNNNMMVMLQKDNSMVGRLLENDVVTFYGITDGTYTYETVRGDSLTVPLIWAVMYDLNENETKYTRPQNNKADIIETVILEENGIKITAKSIQYDGWMGPELKLNVENNFGKAITVQARDVSVNGYMVNPSMSIDVVNGKKANDGMTFSKTEFDECGIDTIADIEFSLHIFDSDSWNTIFDTSRIVLKTDASDGFEYVYDESGKVLYEAGGIKIVAKKQIEKWSGKGLQVYIVNNCGQDICVQARDSSVNGYMIDATMSSEVLNGKRCVSDLTFWSNSLEENDISSIDEIQLYFHIFNKDSWSSIVDTPVITWTAN